MLRRPRHRALVVALAVALAAACRDDGAAQWEAAIEGPRIAEPLLAARQQGVDAAKSALEAADDSKTILFGDLHVHTSYSSDGFLSGSVWFGTPCRVMPRNAPNGPTSAL